MFDLKLTSDVPLPELPRATGAPRLSVRARHAHPTRRRWAWQEEPGTKGAPAWLAIGRCGDDWILRFPRLADFELRDGCRKILAAPRGGLPRQTLRHLLLDVVLPMALSARGHLLLHASGIAGRAGGALFVGATGTGKSTLAASFDGAFRPFSDDAVRVIERAGAVAAVGAYPGARLWPEAVAAIAGARPTHRVAHYTEKQRVPVAATTKRPAVRAIYVMEFPPAPRVTIRRCSRRAAVVALLSHAYCLDPSAADTAREHFARVTALTAAVPVFTLAFPDDLGRLDDVRDTVIEHLASITGTGTTRHGG